MLIVFFDCHRIKQPGRPANSSPTVPAPLRIRIGIGIPIPDTFVYNTEKTM